MRRLTLLLALLLAGCGLSYEVHVPDVFDTPPHVVRGSLLQRSLYAGECEYAFGDFLLDETEPCLWRLTAESRTVLVAEELEFFGGASARLFLNSRDELSAFEVTPFELDQFEGIVEYYAGELDAWPLYAEQISPLVDYGATPCLFVDRDGRTREVGDAIRTATWEDATTRLVVVEHACHGLARLRFADLEGRP